MTRLLGVNAVDTPGGAEVSLLRLASRLKHREDQGHVYIRHADGREHLFDLEGDPSEANDLARAPEAHPRLSTLRDALARALSDDEEDVSTRR